MLWFIVGMNLELKHQKETEKEYAHTEVWHEGIYYGYIMPNHSRFAARNENWNFTSDIFGLESFHAKTREKLLNKLEKEIKEIQ